MFVQVLKPGYSFRPETLATSEVPSAEADLIAQMSGCGGHFTRDSKRVPPVGSCNLSAASDVLLSYLLATSSDYRNSGVRFDDRPPPCPAKELPWVASLTLLGGSRDLIQPCPQGRWAKSGQVRLGLLLGQSLGP